MNTTDKQKLILATILTAIHGGDPIMGKNQAPSGHVYARLMGAVGLMEYRQLLDILKGAGLITERSHLLKLTESGVSVAAEISAVVRANESNVVIN